MSARCSSTTRCSRSGNAKDFAGALPMSDDQSDRLRRTCRSPTSWSASAPSWRRAASSAHSCARPRSPTPACRPARACTAASAAPTRATSWPPSARTSARASSTRRPSATPTSHRPWRISWALTLHGPGQALRPGGDRGLWAARPVAFRTRRSPPPRGQGGVRTVLEYQEVDGPRYFDAAGHSRADGRPDSQIAAREQPGDESAITGRHADRETTADLNGPGVGELEGAPYLALDTEFMRDQTYWPKLCLMQVAAPGVAAIVDPLAEGIDLAPFYTLLKTPGIVKVLHAARQDIEIFCHQGGIIPDPLFDTQIAAMVCGFGDAASYETLAARSPMPRSTNPRASPTGRAGRSASASSNTPSPTSRICARSTSPEEAAREDQARELGGGGNRRRCKDPALYALDPGDRRGSGSSRAPTTSAFLRCWPRSPHGASARRRRATCRATACSRTRR